MAQLPCIGLSWPLTNPPFGSCAIYFHYGVHEKMVGNHHFHPLKKALKNALFRCLKLPLPDGPTVGKPTWIPGEFGTGIPEPKITGNSKGDCYWEGRFQGIPSCGYTVYILWSNFLVWSKNCSAEIHPDSVLFERRVENASNFWNGQKAAVQMKSFSVPTSHF